MLISLMFFTLYGGCPELFEYYKRELKKVSGKKKEENCPNESFIYFAAFGVSKGVRNFPSKTFYFLKIIR